MTTRSAAGFIAQGRGAFILEFRSGVSNALVDVGDVHVDGTMAMPGMLMSASTEVARTGVPGRYQVSGDFSMAGIWKLTVEWSGPAGRGSVVVNGDVQ